jgi:acetyl coenzyme A synthetase (ADP forming)-like protein
MFFNPRAVAIVGASREPGKLGHSILRNVIQHGYRGAIYPINPKADQILGVTCYPSISLAPGPVDLAVIVIPGKSVAGALVECGQKGVKGAIVISAGFREIGPEGWQREREIVDIARRYAMQLIGPNCLGIIDTISRLNASFALGMPRSGSIAFMSQSGALCTAVLDMALAQDVGFSRFVSLGNKADADEITFVEAWRNDPYTSVIMAYVEGIADGLRFMRVAREVSRHKPIIVVKSGTTSAGSRAVSSHTGTLAGSERAYTAAFRQSGVIRARSVEDLFDYSIAFARQPLLAKDRVAIITNAGGPGIMATDACELAGLQLASLEPETMEGLHNVLPGAASVLNPIDLLGDAPAERYGLALRMVLDDANVGGVIVILTPQAMTQVAETARTVGELSRGRAKPVFGSFMGAGTVAPGIDLLNHYGVPNYPVPERAVAAMAAMMNHRRWRERPPVEIETFDLDGERVRAVFARVRAEGHLSIGDVEALEILAACGIRTPRTCLAREPGEAARYAAEIGFPVAVKVASPDILHKTDVGGVALDVTTPGDVREACKSVGYRARHYLPAADVRGCLVQEMVAGGRQAVAAMKRDPGFGPLMTLGLGGAYAGALCEVAFRLAPFDRREAHEMVAEAGAYDLLRGVEGEGPSDLGALVEVLLRLSQLAVEFPEIVEFEVNPMTVFEQGRGLVAVDMRLVLG